MKFYNGLQFPAEYRNNIFLAEHGGWNQRVHTGARVVRIVAEAVRLVMDQGQQILGPPELHSDHAVRRIDAGIR
jgi:glucose/arabinose dehydrogenase